MFIFLSCLKLLCDMMFYLGFVVICFGGWGIENRKKNIEVFLYGVRIDEYFFFFLNVR